MYLLSLFNNNSDNPQQPILKSYGPKKIGKEIATKDFNSNWYNDHPWLEYSVEDKLHPVMHVKNLYVSNSSF